MSLPDIVQLGSVSSILSGFAFKSRDFGKSEGLPIIRIRDVSRGYSDTLFSGEYDERYIVDNGNLLISMDGEFRVAKWKGGTALLNQRVCKISPNEALLHKGYLYHFLPRELKRIEEKTPFVTVKHLSAKSIREISLPLPPIEEQRRIAAILDKADAIRRKREQALALADDFLRTTFLDMFGDTFSNPRNWPKVPLGAISKKFSDGPFGSNLKSDHYVSQGVRVLRLQNIGVGEFIDNDRAYISQQHFETIAKHECKPGDVIIGTLGDPNLRAVIQPKSLPIALNKADCVQCRVDPKMATSEFICELLNQPSTLAAAGNLLHGQTRVRISMGKLRSLEVPIPPLRLQQKFSSLSNTIEAKKLNLNKGLVEIIELKKSLSQRAFRGEL